MVLNKDKKLDVLLFSPPNYFEDDKSIRNFKIDSKIAGIAVKGLLYLAGELIKNEISVKILNPLLDGTNIDNTVKRIIGMQPEILGISVTSLQIRGAVQLASTIKKISTKIKICVGGPHVSIDPAFVSDFNCFDFGIAGEAEITFPKIVKRVLNNEKIEKVIFAETPLELDRIAFPAWDLIDPKESFPLSEKIATLVSTRGCPFNCIFCSRVVISDQVRHHSPKWIVEEIKFLKDKYDSFAFIDDTFTIHRNHAEELCNEIINSNLKIKWSCNTRANLIDFELLKLMKNAGCNLIFLGIETGNENFRSKVLKKRILDSDIIKAVKDCKKIGITVGGYFMLGFPGETKKYMQETVNFPIVHNFDAMSIHATTIYPGTSLEKIYEKENKTSLKEKWNQYARGEKSIGEVSLIYIPLGMTMDDIKRYRKEAYLKFYFRPRIIWYWLKKHFFHPRNLLKDFYYVLSLLKHGKTSRDFK
jgi:anaerobic magnesium-protoporphyrin IX monomethyl ester cyclase